jgi:hypothetical protein
MQESEQALPPRVPVERIEAAVETGEIRSVDPHHTVIGKEAHQAVTSNSERWRA